MEVQIRAGNNFVKATGANTEEVFKELSVLCEVFGETECRKCGNTELRYVVREVDGNEFFELKCRNMDCRARLQFGKQKKSGDLYPKRYQMDGKDYVLDSDGRRKVKGDYGWAVFNPKTRKEE